MNLVSTLKTSALTVFVAAIFVAIVSALFIFAPKTPSEKCKEMGGVWLQDAAACFKPESIIDLKQYKP